MKNVAPVIAAVFIILAGGHLLAALEPEGLLIFSEPPSTYVESCEYSSLDAGPAFTTVSRPDGQTLTYTSVKMTVVAYPTKGPKFDTQEVANLNLGKIKTLIQQYPQFKAQLQRAQTKWETALASAKKLAADTAKAETQAAPTAPNAKTAGVQGEDIKTMDGEEYKNVTISRVEPDGITVITNSGVEKILFTNLPKDLQTKYGYDPAKATAYQQELKRQHDLAVVQAAIAKVKEQINASSLTLGVEVVQVLDKGILARLPDEGWEGYDDFKSGIGDNTVFIEGVGGDCAEGDHLKIKAYRDGTFSYTSVVGADKTIQKWVAVPDK